MNAHAREAGLRAQWSMAGLCDDDYPAPESGESVKKRAARKRETRCKIKSKMMEIEIETKRESVLRDKCVDMGCTYIQPPIKEAVEEKVKRHDAMRQSLLKKEKKRVYKANYRSRAVKMEQERRYIQAFLVRDQADGFVAKDVIVFVGTFLELRRGLNKRRAAVQLSRNRKTGTVVKYEDGSMELVDNSDIMVHIASYAKHGWHKSANEYHGFQKTIVSPKRKNFVLVQWDGTGHEEWLPQTQVRPSSSSRDKSGAHRRLRSCQGSINGGGGDVDLVMCPWHVTPKTNSEYYPGKGGTSLMTADDGDESNPQAEAGTRAAKDIATEKENDVKPDIVTSLVDNEYEHDTDSDANYEYGTDNDEPMPQAV